MRKYPAGDQALVRGINLASVMGLIHQHAPLSRAQLANLTGLNKSTVSSLVEELLDRSLIYQTGLENSGAGRPATLLALNPQAGCIIGVEVGVDFISTILSNFTGQVLWRRFQEINPSEPQEFFIEQAMSIVEQAIVTSRECQTRLLGLGLTLPGLVDIDTGILTFSPNHQWRDVPLGKIFGECTGLPVYVDNDANAGALGEHLFGVARHAQHFVFIVAGVGIGSGLFLNGDLYRGAGGYAGEIGHTSVSGDHSRLCRCGNRGCWENSGNKYALIERVRSRLDVGRPSLIRSMIEATQTPLSLAMINQAAESGDAEALEALHETGFAIGMGAANLINIFNPEMVVIGGSLSVAGKFLLPAILEAIQQRALADTRQQAQVVPSAFGPEASVMGAVAMVVKAILADPTRVERTSRQMA